MDDSLSELSAQNVIDLCDFLSDGELADIDTADAISQGSGAHRIANIPSAQLRLDGRLDRFNANDDKVAKKTGRKSKLLTIETVMPCFTAGTLIATVKGERRIETLEVGDRIITRDNGIQCIRWIGVRHVSGAELDVKPHLKPVLIAQGALGGGLPERDMMVSPAHRLLIANDKTALYFEEREVLVAAKFLTGMEGIDVVDVSGTTAYIQIMFDQHECVLSDGAWSESFQLGKQTLASVGAEQRAELLEMFPELTTQEGVDDYMVARRSLKKQEAKLLTK